MKREWVRVNTVWHKTTPDSKALKCGGGSIEWNGRVTAVVYAEEPPLPACVGCGHPFPVYEVTKVMYPRKD